MPEAVLRDKNKLFPKPGARAPDLGKNEGPEPLRPLEDVRWVVYADEAQPATSACSASSALLASIMPSQTCCSASMTPNFTSTHSTLDSG